MGLIANPIGRDTPYNSPSAGTKQDVSDLAGGMAEKLIIEEAVMSEDHTNESADAAAAYLKGKLAEDRLYPLEDNRVVTPKKDTGAYLPEDAAAALEKEAGKAERNLRMVTPGRIVRYEMPDGTGSRVAIVTDVEENQEWLNRVNLFVFLDATLDYCRHPLNATSILVLKAEFGSFAGQWHWPD